MIIYYNRVSPSNSKLIRKYDGIIDGLSGYIYIPLDSIEHVLLVIKLLVECK